MDVWQKLLKCTSFDWDEGNSSKNWIKHRVSPSESEQVFFNRPLIVAASAQSQEERFYALGKTDAGRFLFVVFTLRKDLVRVISARNMNRKERKVYLSS